MSRVVADSKSAEGARRGSRRPFVLVLVVAGVVLGFGLLASLTGGPSSNEPVVDDPVVEILVTPDTLPGTTAPVGSVVTTAALEPQGPLNGHFYEAVFVSGGIAWQEAKTAAGSRFHGEVAGHLATFTSAEEYDFVVANLSEAFISSQEGLQNPFLLGGFQPPDDPNEPDGNWQWVTGERFVYTNWASGEPNNSGPGPEDCMQIAVGRPQWNDLPCEEHARGYIVEYDVSGTFADDKDSIFE